MSERIVVEEPDWDEMERRYGGFETEEQFDVRMAETEERSRIADETEPRALAARYNAESGRIDVELKDGCLFAFPVHLAQGLRGAAPELLAKVQVMAGGAVLLFEELDTGFMVPVLLERRFGNERWMEMLARERGEAKRSA